MGLERRKFIGGLASIAALPARLSAQQATQARRIGLLMVQAEEDAEGQARIDAFRSQMATLGWVDGRNLHIDYRWGGGIPARAQAAAAELLELKPDLVLANGTPPTAALRKATNTIPVVFVVVTDPVGAGFVESLARPGANITGFSTFEPEIGGKWLELLREVSPDLRRVAGILDPSFAGFSAVWKAVEETAARSAVSTTILPLRSPGDDFETALASFAQEPGGALIVLPTAINSMARNRLFAAAARLQLPAVYPFRHYAFNGGLIAYGFDPLDLYRRSAIYVDRILKGEKPAELPVQAPVKFELVINLKTAKNLGITIPPALLVRADEVIE